MADRPGASSSVASTSYRNPNVEDDDEDDLDDLDDVLASFNAPAPAKAASAKRPYPTSPPKAPTSTASKSPAPTSSLSNKATTDDPSEDAGAPADDDDFEASLVEGMESLLRQLAGDHPPGPMADSQSSKGRDKDRPSAEPTGGSSLSADEEEAAWQRAVEMMLSGEGLEALGLDKDGQPKSARAAPAKSSGTTAQQQPPGARPDFDETIRRTMEQLKSPQGKAAGGGGGGAPSGGGAPDLAALLAQLGSDPSALDGLGGEGDDELGGLLDGMMAQLMTKEILEEPMAELAAKYPGYLAAPPAGTSPEDLAKYTQQHKLVSSIVATFQKPDYSDEKDGKTIAKLVGEMQDLGGPPQEIMGDLPEGFDLGALGNEDGCTIM